VQFFPFRGVTPIGTTIQEKSVGIVTGISNAVDNAWSKAQTLFFGGMAILIVLLFILVLKK
jgi:hypothetical protein